MAIDDQIDIKVIVEGHAAAEFPSDFQIDERYRTEVVTKYVQVVSGARFSFRVTLSPQYRFGEEDCLTLYAYIDGQYAGGVIWNRERHSHIHGSVITCDCKWEGSGRSTRKLEFYFADLKTRETVDKDEFKKMASKYSQLGTLQVNLQRGERGDLVDRASKTWRENETVPEKALKGRSVTVAAKMTPAQFTWASKCEQVRHLDEKPLYMMRFLYRTKEALQSEMVIPRSPSPEPLEDQAEEDLTPEQMRELIRRQRKQLAFKQENHVPKLKRERPLSTTTLVRPLKSTKTSDGKEIFHLDSDDDQPQLKARPITTSRKNAEPVEIIDLG